MRFSRQQRTRITLRKMYGYTWLAKGEERRSKPITVAEAVFTTRLGILSFFYFFYFFFFGAARRGFVTF